MDEEETAFSLLRSVARSDGLCAVEERQKRYLPLFKHPLPISDHRQDHENVLRKISSCKPEKQTFAAICQGDAWTLEEVIMNGAPFNVKDHKGNSPLHLAVQVRSVECIMVLINAGIDVNVTNTLGFTPLYLAHSLGLSAIENFLAENKAKMHIDIYGDAPPETVLDVIPQSATPHQIVNSPTKREKMLGQPSKYSNY